ncbi:GNAT family N-acetyltransferase [Dictyobacter halimunensis]|uniref:GNAT family N-acetyltransferase n=1 Tax=Dictyobacter halimunensis TaxID=3026934 RepID=UPI003B9866F1
MSPPQTHLYTGEEPWSRDKTTAHLHWLLDHRIGWESGTFPCPLILRSTHRLIGRVGLNPFLEDTHIPEIAWTSSPKHWGKG